MSDAVRGSKNHFVHLSMSDGQPPKAYRVNDYEYDLLLDIQEREHLDNESETIRFIIREAATKRKLIR